MTKKIFAVIIAFLLCFSVTVFASAYTEQYVFCDSDGCLSTSEIAELESYAQAIEENYGRSVIFCIVDDIGNLTCYEYAQEIASEYTDAEDTVVFVNDIQNNVYDYYKSGNAERLDDSLIEGIYGIYNNDKSYFNGISSLYAAMEETLENADEEEFYLSSDDSEDEEHEAAKEKEKGKVSFIWIPICLAIGILIGFLIIKGIASKNISVKMQKNATVYTRSGSMTVTGRSDNFLYKEVEKRAKPKNNNKQ